MPGTVCNGEIYARYRGMKTSLFVLRNGWRGPAKSDSRLRTFVCILDLKSGTEIAFSIMLLVRVGVGDKNSTGRIYGSIDFFGNNLTEQCSFICNFLLLSVFHFLSLLILLPSLKFLLNPWEREWMISLLRDHTMSHRKFFVCRWELNFR